MADKDFLEQFASSDKPDSFKEEKRIPINKEKKPLNVKALIIVLLIVLFLGILIYFLFFAPKIAMPNFVDKSMNDVTAWVKQQDIETSGIVFEDVYDLEKDEGTILSQSILEGKKVKKNVKLNFVVSKGADPDEKIKVPDLKDMTKQEIQKWIDDNKLQKTKLMTAYNDEVKEDEVIDYSFSGCDEDSFTRACSLKINVSKGVAPAGKVSVEDFEKKPYETAETWAKSKKINLVKTYAYSDTIGEDMIISQSIAAGKTISEGDSLTVVVSKGKAVYMPNMIGWDIERLNAWQQNNAIIVHSEERYSSANEGLIYSQSIEAGKLLNKDSYVKVSISKGNTVDLSKAYDLDSLNSIVEEANGQGANITLNISKDFSENNVDTIISCDKKVNVNGTANVLISRGRNILLNDPFFDEIKNDPTSKSENETREKINALGLAFKFEYQNSSLTDVNGVVVEIRRSDGIEIASNTYCPQDVTIIVVVNDESR